MELEKYLSVMMGREADALKRLLELETDHTSKAWAMEVIMKRLNGFCNDFKTKV